MFDCVLPTRSGRTGLAFTWGGKVNLKNSKYKNDKSSLVKDLNFKDLEVFSKSYLNHLVKTNEMLASMIITLNNIQFYQQFMNGIRKSIKSRTFTKFYNKYFKLFNQ